jgi:endonuclease III
MAAKSASKKARTERISELASKNFPAAAALDGVTVLDQLVRCLIARRTAQGEAWSYLDKLRQAFVDWNEARVSTKTQIAMTLERREWADEIAAQIRDVLMALHVDRQEVSLDFLTLMTPTHVRNYLMKLPHVDRVLADEVMLLALAYPAIPYSDDMARLAHRLGYVPDDRITVRSQRTLARNFSEEELPGVHYFLQSLLTDHCGPDLEKCEECPLINYCPGQKKKRSRTKKAKKKSARPAAKKKGARAKSGAKRKTRK